MLLLITHSEVRKTFVRKTLWPLEDLWKREGARRKRANMELKHLQRIDVLCVGRDHTGNVGVGLLI
jgi:hypothetical protein